jgi:hypothetical protein
MASELFLGDHDLDPPASSSSTTFDTSAGCSALTRKVGMSSDHGMMSIFSPCKLVDNRLHAAAAHTDTGADRVDELS